MSAEKTKRPLYKCLDCAGVFTTNHKKRHLEVHHAGKSYDEIGQPVKLTDLEAIDRRPGDMLSAAGSEADTSERTERDRALSLAHPLSAQSIAPFLPSNGAIQRCAISAFRRAQLGVKMAEIQVIVSRLYPSLTQETVRACVQSALAIHKRIVLDMSDGDGADTSLVMLTAESRRRRSPTPAASRSPSSDSGSPNGDDDERSEKDTRSVVDRPICLLTEQELSSMPDDIFDGDDADPKVPREKEGHAVRQPEVLPACGTVSTPGAVGTKSNAPLVVPRRESLDRRLEKMLSSKELLHIADVGAGEPSRATETGVKSSDAVEKERSRSPRPDKGASGGSRDSARHEEERKGRSRSPRPCNHASGGSRDSARREHRSESRETDADHSDRRQWKSERGRDSSLRDDHQSQDRHDAPSREIAAHRSGDQNRGNFRGRSFRPRGRGGRGNRGNFNSSQHEFDPQLFNAFLQFAARSGLAPRH